VDVAQVGDSETVEVRRKVGDGEVDFFNVELASADEHSVTESRCGSGHDWGGRQGQDPAAGGLNRGGDASPQEVDGGGQNKGTSPSEPKSTSHFPLKAHFEFQCLKQYSG
jgi:hypothetical protein